ncbi:hypothetical protein RB608_17510 [Nocardioides sp. LHD-245]|uniref:hypothetical protein n=1 Tax=Nocardioides sp. LHD-245 TaxID=3051387 RepID=UPI0027DEAD5D|nr:hypothetical protein [Nocardioides sp. LHD-245]
MDAMRSEEHRRRVPRRWVLRTAVVVTIVGFLLTVIHPTIDEGRQARGAAEEPATCLAPFHTVLDGADNFPGGEPPLNGESIAAKCREAGRTRYRQGIVLMGVGGLAGLGVAIAVLRSRVRERRNRVSA